MIGPHYQKRFTPGAFYPPVQELQLEEEDNATAATSIAEAGGQLQEHGDAKGGLLPHKPTAGA